KGKKNYASSNINNRAESRDLQLAYTFDHYCQKYFLTHFSVKDIARKMNISAKYLSEIVSKITGKKALAILNQYRINYAKGLLLQTNMTPTQIAYELNFENPGYFFTFFKKATGLTPLQFRQI
ncbi:MAG: helix-turn-helix transcriptional regulator, partial [Bacteroidota bacterium]